MGHNRRHHRRRTLALSMMDWQLALTLAVFTAVLAFAVWDLIIYPIWGEDDE